MLFFPPLILLLPLPLIRGLKAPRALPSFRLGKNYFCSFSRCLQGSSVPSHPITKVPSTAVPLFPQVLLLSLERTVCCGKVESDPRQHSSRELSPQISLFNVSNKQVVTPLVVNSWIFLPNTPETKWQCYWTCHTAGQMSNVLINQFAKENSLLSKLVWRDASYVQEEKLGHLLKSTLSRLKWYILGDLVCFQGNLSLCMAAPTAQ